MSWPVIVFVAVTRTVSELVSKDQVRDGSFETGFEQGYAP